MKELSAFRVLRPGVLTTVQDLGRTGFIHIGVPVSGAMDPAALAAGNVLLGNRPGEAALEITLSDLELEVTAERPITLALTGAPAAALLNDAPAPFDEPVTVRQGDRLALKPASPPKGARTYLCVEGGFAVPLVLGSRSTFLAGRFGGFEGRQLRKDDELRIIDRKRRGRGQPHQLLREGAIMRFIPHEGPHGLSQDEIAAHLERVWRVDPQSNRMGIRLRPAPGTKLPAHKSATEYISQAVFFGAIQLPPDGEPIILGADAQTIGGYPLVGCVISADLWKCGQALPGGELRLQAIGLEAAHELSFELEPLSLGDEEG